MSRNLSFVAALAAITIPGLMTTQATADSSAGPGKHARSATHAAPQHRRWHVAHYGFAHRFGEGPAGYYAAPPNVPVIHEPGYHYVPRMGILDEACNLPTSACPNEMRDIQ